MGNWLHDRFGERRGGPSRRFFTSASLLWPLPSHALPAMTKPTSMRSARRRNAPQRSVSARCGTVVIIVYAPSLRTHASKCIVVEKFIFRIVHGLLTNAWGIVYPKYDLPSLRARSNKAEIVQETDVDVEWKTYLDHTVTKEKGRKAGKKLVEK